MAVIYKLLNGTNVAVSRGLRDRGQPIVRMSYKDGERRVLMLASPANARGFMADTLHELGAEDLADGLRHAAWEAMKLAGRSPFAHT